jgi:hypothetical protein
MEIYEKPKYNTIEEYLEKLLYPTLRESIKELLEKIKELKLDVELEKEFNDCFYRKKAEIQLKKKQLLKLERASDYSESDYEYWLRNNHDPNETKSDKIGETKNEFDEGDEDDLDIDDSDLLNFDDEESGEMEEKIENKFDPIKFLEDSLRRKNRNKPNDNLGEPLDNTRGNEKEDNL